MSIYFVLWFISNLFPLVMFQIFHTPEGLLSSEQGVYIAESVAAKNMKQAKGRFRMYEDLDDTVPKSFFYLFI